MHEGQQIAAQDTEVRDSAWESAVLIRYRSNCFGAVAYELASKSQSDHAINLHCRRSGLIEAVSHALDECIM